MKGWLDDYPTEFKVQSEEEGDRATYHVILDDIIRGTTPEGQMIFNGSCTCKDFRFRHSKSLRSTYGEGKIFRCKHIQWARAQALDFMLPYLHTHNPNRGQ